MAVEYNLVILGDGPVARYAAEYARSLNARVALVTGCSSNVSVNDSTGLYTDTLAIQTLRHIGQALPTYIQGPYQAGPLLFPDLPSQIPSPQAKIDWTNLLSLAQTLITGQLEGRSLSALEQLGVDVVYSRDVGNDDTQRQQSGIVEFYQDTVVGLKTSRRPLPSQAYLIAMDGDPIVPAIPGIEDVAHTTLDTFLHPDAGTVVPTSVLIISNNQQGVETAYALGTLGISITLVMACEFIVADQEAHQWINTSLRTMGIKVYWGTSVVRIEQRQGQCVAHLTPLDEPDLEPTASIADSLLLAMGRQVDFTKLQLGNVGVTYDAQGIVVNSNYQSNQPRLFACGDAIQSPPALNQRYAEVAIAVHQALFGQSLWSNAWLSHVLMRVLNQWLQPSLPLAPSSLPNSLNISPPLAWIGYNETEARQQYGDRLTIIEQSYQSLDQAQLLGAHYAHSTAGWCKLLVIEDGQIVGAYVWGLQAEEVIGAISFAMRQSIPMEEVGQQCSPMPSITAELFQALGLQWEQERIKRRPILFDWLEMVFNWQRDWTKASTK